MCFTQIQIVFYILITPQLLSLRKIIYKSFNVSYLFYGPRKSTFFAIENEGKENEYGNSSVSVCIFLLFSHSVVSICDPMNSSMTGFPVLYHLQELAETHVLSVGDAIQPSHALSSPSPTAYNLAQHWGLSQ